MGDLQVGEVFQDRCFITVLATGLPATALADITIVIIDELGNRAAGVVTEQSDGWYTSPFTPDAVGTWAVEWGKTANPEDYVFHYPYKEFKVGGGEVTDIKTETADILGHVTTTDGHITADYTATEKAAIDLLDDAAGGLLDIHTDVADVHTDVGTVHTDVDAVRARTDRLEITKTFFSPSQIEVIADTSHTDANLPTVTLPNIAGTITHVYAGFKFRMIENTNAAVNKLSGAQEIQVDTVDAINFVDDQFGLAASTREGGDCIIGAVDLVATVDVFNHGYAFVWDEPLTDQNAIHFNDVQTFLIVSYY